MLDLHLALLEVGDVDPETDRPAGWRELLRPFEPALADCLAHDLRALAAETRDPFLGRVLERRAELLRELGGLPRQLLVGDADDAGPLQQRRRDDGGGIEHLQPLVLVVDHDARRQAVDRLLQEVARLSGRLPLPLMFHRGMADQQDQHQSGGDETCRTERQNKQRRPVVVDQLADQGIDAARIRGTRGVEASELDDHASQRRAVEQAVRRGEGLDLARQQIVYRGSVVADRVLPIAMGWHTRSLATGRRQRRLELRPCLAQRGCRLGRLNLIVGHQVNAIHQPPRALVERQQLGRLVPGVARLSRMQRQCNGGHGNRAAYQADDAGRRGPGDPARAEGKPGLVGKGPYQIEKPHELRSNDLHRTP